MEAEVYLWLSRLSRAAYFTYFGVGVLVYVATAFLCFPLWYRTRLRFFAWFGSASLVGLFCSVCGETLLQSAPPDSLDYLLIYSLNLIVGLVGDLFALIGTVQLARYFKERFPGPVPPEPAPGSGSVDPAE